MNGWREHAFVRSACTAVCILSLILHLLPGATSSAQSTMTLVATGSSMPQPLYAFWNEEFHRQRPEIQIRYLPVGTTESARRILAREGDFGGGDAPIPEKDLKAATAPVVELPSVVIGIVVVYNLPSLKADLRLSGPVLADIYLGKVTSWNDPEIAKLNPGADLPHLPVAVVHRSEGKGSSYIFSDYLSKVSPEFQTKVGRSVSPKWPVGASIGRTQDVLEKMKMTPGALGYTELNWAAKSGLSMARIRNAAGAFVKPSIESIDAAATALENQMGDDFRVSLTNAPGRRSYPVSSFTWFYVPGVAPDAQRGSAVAEYLRWVYSDGQKIAKEQGYAALPASVLAKVRAKTATVR